MSFCYWARPVGTQEKAEDLSGNCIESPSKSQEITNRTEPNTQQDQGHYLQFESVEQEERQYNSAQRDHIELLETYNAGWEDHRFP